MIGFMFFVIAFLLACIADEIRKLRQSIDKSSNGKDEALT